MNWKPLLPAALLLVCTGAIAQTPAWEKDLEIGWESGMEWNVFHSPRTYFDNTGVAWSADSLVRDDQLNALRVDMGMTREDAQGEWHLDLDGSASRYRRFREADRRSLDFRFGREQKLNERTTADLTAWVRDEKRLGLNILGDELLTSFSFTQLQADFVLDMEVNDRLEVGMEGEVYRKWYDQRVEGRSLDQTEWTFELAANYTPQRRKKGLRDLDLVGQQRTEKVGELTAVFSYRQKNFLNYLNFDILDPDAGPLAETPFLPFDSTFAHPLRTWAYSNATLKYAFPDWGPWSLRLDARRQWRRDASLGDFGYRDAKGSLRVTRDSKRLELGGVLSYTWRTYTDRPAEQAVGVPFPLLKYTYLRCDLIAEYRLRKGLLLTTLVDFTARTSNTTAEDRRTRRGYRTGTVMIGLSAELK